jgi:RNA polymerase sigma-70 factor (ECF subfamily)
LVARVIAGDEQAWVDFCHKYESLVAACAMRVLRRYGVQLATATVDDLVAEVWLALLRNGRHKLRIYDPARGCRLSTWLGMIATNTVIDYLRVNHTPSAYLEDHPQVDLQLVDGVGPDAALEHQQRAVIARQALRRLKAEEQRFVCYCFADEREPTDIARLLGISVNTVHSRKFKLREKLTRLVAQLAPA